MILKEYTAKDSESRNRLFVDVRCDNCDTVYKRQKRFLKDCHGCSPRCLSILKGTLVFVDCSHCGETCEKKKSALNNSKSGLYFCSRSCKDKGQTYIEEIMPPRYNSGTGIHSYRKKALEHYGRSCVKCGYNNIGALEVHHIDKNRNNNKLGNLQVLCCNCHTLAHRGI